MSLAKNIIDQTENVLYCLEYLFKKVLCFIKHFKNLNKTLVLRRKKFKSKRTGKISFRFYKRNVQK